MTMGQFVHYCEGFYERKVHESEDNWLRTREVVYLLYNTNILKHSDMLSREELMPLPSDKTRSTAKSAAQPVVLNEDSARRQSEQFFHQLDAFLSQM